MLWIIGSAALLLSIFLAFRFAETPRALYATLGIIALLAIAGTTLFLVETRQSAKRQQASISRVAPNQISIADARLSQDYGRWQLSGSLTNNSGHRITWLSVDVTVKECAGEGSCKVTGSTRATHYGMDVAPGERSDFQILLYLPDTPMPRQMEWAYEVVQVGAGG